MAKRNTIEVKDKTIKSLKVLKAKMSMDSYDSLIEWLLTFHKVNQKTLGELSAQNAARKGWG